MSAMRSVARQSSPTICGPRWSAMIAADTRPLLVIPSPQVPSSAVTLHQTFSHGGSHLLRCAFTCG